MTGSLVLVQAPPAVVPKDLTVVGGWRGAYVANLNTSGASWLTNTAPYETWLSSTAPSNPVKVTQALGYCDTGTWGFNSQAFTIMSNWRSLLADRPNLTLRLAVPMLVDDSEWDALLVGDAGGTAGSGFSDAKFQSINDSIVLHDSTDFPGSAALIRIRLGWEGNGDWYAWGHRPASNGFTGSTYSSAKYRAGWRRIAGLFAGARAAGAKLVYNPALALKNVTWGISGATGQWPGADDAGTAIPGFNLVDVLGGDAYDQWLGGPSLTGAQRWSAMYDASNGIASLLSFAASHGNLPVSFDEWGIDLRLSDASNPTKPSGDDDYYIQQISAVMQTLIDAGKFDGHVYWESNSAIQSKISTSAISPLCQAAFLNVWGAP